LGGHLLDVSISITGINYQKKNYVDQHASLDNTKTKFETTTNIINRPQWQMLHAALMLAMTTVLAVSNIFLLALHLNHHHLPTHLSIPLIPFNTRILITSRQRTRPTNLLAVISLCSPSGVPLPAGHLLTTSKLMDSVSEPSRSDLSTLGRGHRQEIVGVAGFDGLCVQTQGSIELELPLRGWRGMGGRQLLRLTVRCLG
ncbi:unnamed protein product, partial [Aureobasidium vineae]